MRKIYLLLAMILALTTIAAPSLAEEAVIKENASGFYYIEANGDQPRLSAADKAKFMQVEGLWFKDMNGNGKLDVYEDWRADVADRVADVLSRMTIDQKAGTLIFSGIAGKNGIVCSDLSGSMSAGTGATSFIGVNHEALKSHAPLITVNNVNYCPMPFQVQDMGVTTYIAALTGTPKDQLDLLNAIQKLGEDTSLGIPIVFSGDRSYNTWGGMIDMAHYAFSIAHDGDLLYKLVSEYSKESVALGYHQVFHGYGNEIGSWYGDEVNYIAKMTAIETRAYNDWGFNSHSKHFIARGGRSNYAGAKSPADLIDSWMVGWKAVVDAGTQWIMTNNSVGVTGNTLQTYMDKDTYALLRNELGYKGIICLDWPLSITSLMQKTGTTSDGLDISTLSAVQRYALILNTGIDMFSALGVLPGKSVEGYTTTGLQIALPALIVQAVEEGLVTDIDVHVGRVLKNKFDQGIFENPYRGWEEALALIGNGNYTAASATPLSNADIDLYRRPEIAAMEEELMVKSTIMFKNDGILPLKQGVKIFANSNNSNIKAADATALAAYGTLVDSYKAADVVIYHTTAFDENYKLMVEDATAAGKPIILIYEGTVGRSGGTAEPMWAQVSVSNAVLMQTYNNTPDHGSSVGSFYRYVNPSITAKMLFGVKDPAGSTVFEVPYKAEDGRIAWGELQHDIGVDKDVRLYMAMLAKENPNILMPNNLGDVLYTTNFGMSYANPADIELSLMTVDQAVVTTVDSNGRSSTSVVNATQKAGEAFEISFVAKNNGGDGHVTVQVKDGNAVVAEKFVSVDGGAWRVINIELTLEAGEHVISIGDMSTKIVVK